MAIDPVEMTANSLQSQNNKRILRNIFFIILAGIVLLQIHSLLLLSYEYFPELFMPLFSVSVGIDLVAGLGFIFIPIWKEPRWLKAKVLAVGSCLLTVLAFGLTWTVPGVIPALIVFLLQIDVSVSHPGVTTAQLLPALPLVPAVFIFGLLGISLPIPQDSDIDPRTQRNLKGLSWAAFAINFALLIVAGCTFIIWGLS